MKNLTQEVFNLNYWFRYASHGEQETDFENVRIEADSLDDARFEVMRRFSTPNCRIFKIEEVPTLTMNDLKLLTQP